MPTSLGWKHVFRIWLFALPVLAGLLFVVHRKDPTIFIRARHWEQTTLHSLNALKQRIPGLGHAAKAKPAHHR